MERYTEKHYGENGYYLICSGNCETLNCGDCGILDKIVDRLAAYEDIGLEPEEIELLAKQRDLYADVCGELPLKRIRELAQADREGRVRIEDKTYQCPKCGTYRLTPRVDGKFYLCFNCKTQFTKEDAEAALRREQE